MGINCLLPFIKKRLYKEKSVSEFEGKVAAVDGSCWLHKALYLSLKESGGRERLREIIKKYLKVLITAKVVPWIIFDGLKLPAKQAENLRRERIRKEQAATSAANAAHISYQDIVEVIKVCKSLDVKYIVSPYEADAQICHLINSGVADFAITEDSDLLAYGCPEVLAKMKMNGRGEYYHLPSILNTLDTNADMFLNGCILAGCDYLKNPPRIGIYTAFKKLAEIPLETILDELEGMVPGYKAGFKEAKNVFLHQTVFNIHTGATSPLYDWETAPSVAELHHCGDLLEKQFGHDLASGNIDVASKVKCHAFPLLQIEIQSVPQSQSQVQDSLNDKIINLTILEVRDILHKWTIPAFPVLTLEFREVKVLTRHGEQIGLVESKHPLLTGDAICNSHCEIDYNNQRMTVFWDISMVSFQEIEQSDGDSEECSDPEDLENLQPDVEHTLPFKVLGSCYTKERQAVLSTAFDYLYEHNRPVFARLKAEPDNVHDSDAIAVLIMSETDSYSKVGYIAKELTKYVHPCLSDPYFRVDVKSIKFRTTFMMMGFYLTLSLTKRGLWDKKVVQASRGVRG